MRRVRWSCIGAIVGALLFWVALYLITTAAL